MLELLQFEQCVSLGHVLDRLTSEEMDDAIRAVEAQSPPVRRRHAIESGSVFSYTVPTGGGFTVKSDTDSIVLKLWTFSGDGTCPDQGGDQFFFWRVDCAGPTCGAVSLTGGYQELFVPAGTPINTLFNLHVGVSSPISVGAADTITLSLRSPLYYLPIQWSAPKGPGVSYLSILTG